MKWGTMLIFLYVFQVATILFMGLYDENSNEQTMMNMYTNSTSTSGEGSAPTWAFFVDPTGWSSSSLFKTLEIILITGGTIGIGFYLVFRIDLALLFGFFLFILGLGAIPIMNMWHVVYSEVGVFACVPGPPGVSCFPALLAAMFTAGLLGLLYIFSALEWWSNRQTT